MKKLILSILLLASIGAQAQTWTSFGNGALQRRISGADTLYRSPGSAVGTYVYFYSKWRIDNQLALKANLSGANFTGNVGVRTDKFTDAGVYPWSSPVSNVFSVKGLSSGGADRNALSMITYDSMDRPIASFDNSGRMNLVDYSGAGAVAVLYNFGSPSTANLSGHYAFGARNGRGELNTTAFMSSYVVDTTSTSMSSAIDFRYMTNLNTVGSYSQPNSTVRISKAGFDLGGLNIVDLVRIAKNGSELPTVGPSLFLTNATGNEGSTIQLGTANTLDFWGQNSSTTIWNKNLSITPTDGNIQIRKLSGGGTSMVLADASGNLSKSNDILSGIISTVATESTNRINGDLTEATNRTVSDSLLSARIANSTIKTSPVYAATSTLTYIDIAVLNGVAPKLVIRSGTNIYTVSNVASDANKTVTYTPTNNRITFEIPFSTSESVAVLYDASTYTSDNNAVTLLGTEPQGFAIDATTDQTNLAVKVVDTTTPANNFEGSMNDFLAGTIFTEAKVITLANGNLGWSDHNLFLYSEDFTQTAWSKTVMTAGAKDATGLSLLTTTSTTASSVRATIQSALTNRFYVASFIFKAGTAGFGWINIASSGDAIVYFNMATGAVGTTDPLLTVSTSTNYVDGTALPSGEFRITVSRRALTASTVVWFGLCNADGSQTVTSGVTGYLRRANVNTGVRQTNYLLTTGASKYGVPYDWSRGFRTILIEEGAVTFASRYGDDLTNAAWTASNVTAVLNATSSMGEPASTLTATATNGTIIQAVTSASTSHTFQARVRRKTGTGIISITADNGATWTDVTSQLNSTTYSRVYVHYSGTNPNIGFRIGTSGDEIEVSMAISGAKSTITSPVPIYGANVIKATNLFRILMSRFPTGSAFTTYFDYNYGTDPAGGDALGGFIGAADFHRIGTHAGMIWRTSTVGANPNNWSYMSDPSSSNRVEGTLRLKDNDIASNAFGFGESFENRNLIGSLTNLQLTASTNQIFLRRIISVPRGLADNELKRWKYSGSGADLRYVDDMVVTRFQELPTSSINREPTVQVLEDNDQYADLLVVHMNRFITPQASSGEMPARLVQRFVRFDKATKRLTGLGSTTVNEQQALWASGLGNLQGPKLIKIEQGEYQGRLLLIYTQLDKPSGIYAPPPNDWRRIYCKYSDDNGVTWSTGVVIDDEGDGYVTSTTSGSHVQITQGIHKGRIVIPTTQNTSNRMLYTDDGGITWIRGNTIDTGYIGATYEPSLSLRPNGSTIITTVRVSPANIPSPAPGYRKYAYSTDGGVNFTNYTDLIGYSGIDVSMSTLQNDPSGLKGRFGELLLIGARSFTPFDRSGLTIEELKGELLTPSGVKFLPVTNARKTGYVDARKIGGGYIAIAYENNTESTGLMDIRLMVIKL